MIKFLSKVSKSKLQGTAVVRLDFNTEDEWRMEAALPTVKFLLKQGCKILVISHKGRPVKTERELSLRKDVVALGKFLGKKVIFIPHFRFQEIKKMVSAAPARSVFVLENIRFLKGESQNSAVLARKLAALGDFYVNEAFAVSHRMSASVAAITSFLPSYAGFELENEIDNLSRVVKNPPKPLTVIIGGGKANDKLGVIKYFKNRADDLLIGGAAANTLLWMKGVDIGKSVADREDKGKFAPLLKYRNLALPVDYRIKNNMILDIGARTVEIFGRRIKRAGTIVWNGPLGLFEEEGFDRGTLGVAEAIAGNRKCFSLAGGGETVAFLKKYGLDKEFSFISTGGGAMLDYLAGERLPGIEALEKSRIIPKF